MIESACGEFIVFSSLFVVKIQTRINTDFLGGVNSDVSFHNIVCAAVNFIDSWLPAGLLVIHRCSIFVKFSERIHVKPILPHLSIYSKHTDIAVFIVSCPQ